MFGLKAIILHDSYYRGIRTRIDCYDQTNNTGDNGAGKTSALTLIPIFYGQEPQKLVDRSADKVSFVDFYLPRDQSMVVFEYERKSGPCCVVMYRKNSNTFAYRFIAGSADAALFSPAMQRHFDEGVEARILLRQHVTQYGFEVSNQYDTTREYRAVLQNDHRRLGRGSSGVKALADAGRYCLGDATTHMQHMEALTSVVLKHDRLLEQFKIMLVDSFLEDQLSIPELPYSPKNQGLIRDLEALDSFRSRENVLRKLVGEYDSLKEDWQFLLSAFPELQTWQSQLVKQKAELEEQVNQIGQQLKQLEEHYQQQRHALRSEKSDTEGSLESTVKALNLLYEQRDSWEQEEIQQKQNDIEALPQFEQSLRDAKQHYDTLLKHVSAEETKMLRAKESLQQSHQKQHAELDQKLKSKLQQQSELVKRHHQQISDYLNERQKGRNALLEQHNESLLELNNLVSEKQSQYQVASYFTEPEQQAISALEQDRKSAQQALNEAQAAWQQALLAESNAKNERDEQLDLLRQQNHELDKLREQQTALSRQLFPADNSLHAFLKNADRPWQQHIAKVLDPQLFSRKDLQPTWGEESATVFGLVLDVSVLGEASITTNEAILQEQLQDVEGKIQLKQEMIQRVDKALREAKKHLETLMVTRTTAERQQKKQQERLQQIELRTEEAKESAKLAAQARIEQAKRVLEQVQAQLKQYQQTTKQERQEWDANTQAQKLQIESDQSADAADLDEQLKHIQQQITHAALQFEQRIADLEAAFQRACAQKGIDEKVLMVAKQALEEAQQRVDTVAQYRERVNQYQAWLITEWSGLTSKQQAEQALQQTLFTIEQQLVRHQTEYDNQTKQWRADQQTHLTTLRGINDELKRIEHIASDIHALEQELPTDFVSQPVVMPTHRQHVQDQCETLLKRSESGRMNLRKQVLEITTELQSLPPATQMGEFWRNISDTRRQSSHHVSSSTTYQLEVIDDISQLINEFIPQAERSIISNIASSGNLIAEYHDTLEHLNRKVNQVSSMLKEKVYTQHTFPAISDIEVQLRSKVAEFEMWPLLKSFKQVWDNWVEQGQQSLPNSMFIQALTELSETMKRSHINSNLYSLVDLTISMRENGRPVHIRTDADLKGASSTGISLLAVIVVFCGMTRFLCPDERVRIHWPLDEIGRLSGANIGRLFELMQQHNIALFCAQPDPTPTLSRYFVVKNELDKKRGVSRYRPALAAVGHNPLLEEGEDHE
ncbi:ATP-binding protein [Vibrio porteresiae]|uniref:ATP-binding protein n=1 Tax=Vibrio porteresiae DSM 19223 TaxID=1123496 RepID=A0ABZ0QCA2_9VIBR|nr:ATP-binding protein [Vibrio porteresiae]WPC73402.1 ATP-binding protein [Vibrio porteresiae DSM 19223]